MFHIPTAPRRRRYVVAPACAVFVVSLLLSVLLGPAQTHAHRLYGHVGQLAPAAAAGGGTSEGASANGELTTSNSEDAGTPDQSSPQDPLPSTTGLQGSDQGNQSKANSGSSPLGLPEKGSELHGSNDHQGAAGAKSDASTEGLVPLLSSGLGGKVDQEGARLDEAIVGSTESRDGLVREQSGETGPSVGGLQAGESNEFAVLEPDSVPTAEELVKFHDQAVTKAHQLIRKPALDTTQYVAFNLRDLGLKGLASVDKTQEAGAFAVSVGCGYFHDPPEIPGLAHMLEHMIFLGSSSQARATAWDELISSKGGMHNAHTKPDVTTFYVTAPTQHIPELLRVFLQHLFNPAFLPEQVQSEAMAVQYEHEKNIPDLERVALHAALKYLSDSGTSGLQQANKTPVSAKFGTGSIETLCNKPTQNGIDMLESMKRFHRKCYVPSNMSISLRMGRMSEQGTQRTYRLLDVVDIVSLSFREALKKESTSKYDEAAPDDVEAKVLTSSEEAQEPLASLTQIDAKRQVNTMLKATKSKGAAGSKAKDAEYSSNLAELECQPSSVVQYLLEHPGKGGLIGTLKQKGYISKGEAFKHWTTRSSILGLALDITDRGESEHGNLMSIIRQFAENVQATIDESFVSEYFANYKSISQLLWQSQDPLSPLDQVVISAEASLQYPSRPDLTLNTGVCISTLSSDLIYKEVRRLVEAMAPGKEVVVGLAPSGGFANDESVLQLVEYGVAYVVEKGGKKVSGGSNKLETPRPLACKVPEAEVHPHPPPSVCMSFSAGIPKISADRSNDLLANRNVASPPCVLLSDDNLTIVWHNGSPFNKPIVRSFIKARLEDTEATARNDAFGKIFTLVLAERAKLVLSEFHGCGVDLIVAYTGGSMVFELQSFSSVAEEVMKGLASAFKDTIEDVTEDEFNLAVAGLKEDMSDFSASTAYELAMDVALSIVRQGRYSQFDLKEQLSSAEFNFPNFKSFIGGSLGKTAVDCFLMGGIDASKAKNLALDFVNAIRSSPLSYEKAAGTKTLNLTSDVQVILKNPIPGDVNSALVSLYISEPPDILESVLYSTIGEMIRAPFFDTVRTINMDGYVASASVTELPPVVALGTIVQSSLRTPEELEQHVGTFLCEMSESIGSDLSSAEFKQRVSWAGQSAFSREQSSFTEFFSGMVSQISSRGFCFIKSELSALAAQNFVRCPKSLKKYLKKLVRGDSRHRVTVKLEAGTMDEKDEDSGEERQCKLPGGLIPPTTNISPVGLKRAQPAHNSTETRLLGNTKRDLIEQRTNKAEEPNNEEHQMVQKELQLQEQPVAPGNSSAEGPLALVDKASSVYGHADHVSQLRGSSSVTAVGVSADAELSRGVVDEAVEKEAKNAKVCEGENLLSAGRTVTLTSFADKPQEERQRLLTSLSTREESSSTITSTSRLWTDYNFDRYCTVHEATMRETNGCQTSTDDRASQIIQEDNNWVQLASAASGDSAQNKPADDSAADKAFTEASQQQTQLSEQQHQQTRLLQLLQEHLSAAAAERETGIESSRSVEFLSAQAPSSTPQMLFQPQLQHAAVSLENGQRLTALSKTWALLQQQQHLLQPRVAYLRRYGYMPSIVFSADGRPANNMTWRNQLLLGGGVPRSLLGTPASALQVKEQQLRMLQARRQVIEQRIQDIRRRMFLSATADAQAVKHG
ncbi:hypothetical protein Efla_000711 [Eimeria flavescens]